MVIADTHEKFQKAVDEYVSQKTVTLNFGFDGVVIVEPVVFYRQCEVGMTHVHIYKGFIIIARSKNKEKLMHLKELRDLIVEMYKRCIEEVSK